MKFGGNGPGAVILGGSSACVTAARNLADYGVDVCIFGAPISAARFSRAVRHFFTWPKWLTLKGVPDYLVRVARAHDFRGWALFPCGDEHLRIVAQHAPLLSKYYALTTPSWETARVLYDKRRTNALAHQAGVPIPQTYSIDAAERIAAMDLAFPVVLKPAVTHPFLRATKRKAFSAHNRQEFCRLFQLMSRVIGASQVIVQECLPDPARNLFSFAGYFQNGKPIVGLSVRRMRQFPMDFGRVSTLVETVEIPELEHLATRLLETIRYTGLAEVEFMWHEKHARFELLEVNARLWAWHSLAIAAGIDLPYVAYAQAVGAKPPLAVARPGVKWLHFRQDLWAAVQGIRSGNLSLRGYLGSLRGTKAFSLYAPSDPMPSCIEPFLALFDRLWRWTPREGLTGRLIFKEESAGQRRSRKAGGTARWAPRR